MQIIYFKICNSENEYKNIHKIKTTKYKIINKIIEKLYYYKLKINFKFNIVETMLKDKNKTCIIYSKLENENKTLEKIENKIKKVLFENKNSKIIISKQIKQLVRKNIQHKKILSIILKESEENKEIYKDFLNEIIKSIIKLKNEIPEEESIYILLNSNKTQYTNWISKIVKEYKTINIVTEHAELFKKIEQIAEENFEPILILNNKRKSIAKAKYIINLDYDNEKIIKYCINRNAVIFNVNFTKIKNLNNFDGTIINNIDIVEKNNEYDIKDEYIVEKLYINEIHEAIEKYKYELEGNNGKIQLRELL